MKNPLEEYVTQKLKSFDSKSRRTRASGASTEVGDVLNHIAYVECKMRSRPNWIVERRVLNKLLAKRAKQQKWCLLAIENQYKERVIVMEAEEFFVLFTQWWEANNGNKKV